MTPAAGASDVLRDPEDVDPTEDGARLHGRALRDPLREPEEPDRGRADHDRRRPAPGQRREETPRPGRVQRRLPPATGSGSVSWM